jgi:hypothetical protein
MFRNIFLLLFVLQLLSCRKENAGDCFKANGQEVSQTRNPGEFLEVEVFDKIELHVKQGAACKVEITAGKNLMKNLHTSIEEGRLKIDNRNTCNFVRGYKRGIKVVVTMPYLKYLQNSGVGTAYVEDFRQDTLVVRAESSGDVHVSGHFNEIRTSSHGNGDMYLEGSCNSFYIYTYGTNYVHAGQLRARDFSFVHSITLGDCTVNTDSTRFFSCNVESDGNVYYQGEPLLLVDYSKKVSKGRLIKK